MGSFTLKTKIWNLAELYASTVGTLMLKVNDRESGYKSKNMMVFVMENGMMVYCMELV